LFSVNSNRSSPAPELLQKIFDAVQRFAGGGEPVDDLTLLVLTYQRSAENGTAPDDVCYRRE